MKQIFIRFAFYVKVAAVIAATVFYAILAFIAMLFRGKKKFYSLSKKWSKSLLNIVGIKVKLIGQENLQYKGSFVFVSNHASLFDIPLLLSSIPHNVGIIYKKELEKIPVLGWILALSPFIAIQRQNARNSMESVEQAIQKIQNGESIIVFPEGTRSTDGKLQRFKRGAFLIAARSKKPLIPISIKGANKILPKGSLSFNSGIVSISILPPIFSEANSSIQEKQLLELIEEQIRAELN